MKNKNISSSKLDKRALSLREAIDYGEYDPSYLSSFDEWDELSPHIQWEYIRQALDVRQKQLMSQYAEMNNVLNFSKKPEVQKAVSNLETKLSQLANDRERLYIEYSMKEI